MCMGFWHPSFAAVLIFWTSVAARTFFTHPNVRDVFGDHTANLSESCAVNNIQGRKQCML